MNPKKDNLTDATKGAQEDSEKVENFKENRSKTAIQHLEEILWDLCSDTGLFEQEWHKTRAQMLGNTAFLQGAK